MDDYNSGESEIGGSELKDSSKEINNKIVTEDNEIANSKGAITKDESNNKGVGDKDLGDNVIKCRGTGNGLVLMIDGSFNFFDLKPKLEAFLEARSSFINGSEVALEWFNKKPSSILLKSTKEFLQKRFGINIAYSKSSNAENTAFKVADMKNSGKDKSGNVGLKNRVEVTRIDDGNEKTSSRLGLFGGIESLDTDLGGSKKVLAKEVGFTEHDESSESHHSFLESSESDFPSAWDDADARIIWGTLRSGQKIESDHSIIIVGDVNSGAEVVAGGDIIVLGKLRGVAHAGAYDETGGGKFIFAITLLPTQLRIGMVISRGSEQDNKLPEIAYIDGSNICVEVYNSRVLPKRIRS